MSDDWVQKYINVYQQKQNRARLAQSLAPDTFGRLRTRIQHDVKTLQDDGAFPPLYFDNVSTKSFTVMGSSPTTYSDRLMLTVTLEGIIIQYQHTLPQKETNTGALCICADLGGVVRVHCNRNGETFADESEVSEFLLRLLLDYIVSQ